MRKSFLLILCMLPLAIHSAEKSEKTVTETENTEPHLFCSEKFKNIFGFFTQELHRCSSRQKQEMLCSILRACKENNLTYSNLNWFDTYILIYEAYTKLQDQSGTTIAPLLSSQQYSIDRATN